METRSLLMDFILCATEAPNDYTAAPGNPQIRTLESASKYSIAKRIFERADASISPFSECSPT
jgi:hypothetical protein